MLTLILIEETTSETTSGLPCFRAIFVINSLNIKKSAKYLVKAENLFSLIHVYYSLVESGLKWTSKQKNP
jgi:hypothetical protein